MVHRAFFILVLLAVVPQPAAAATVPTGVELDARNSASSSSRPSLRVSLKNAPSPLVGETFPVVGATYRLDQAKFPGRVAICSTEQAMTEYILAQRAGDHARTQRLLFVPKTLDDVESMMEAGGCTLTSSDSRAKITEEGLESHRAEFAGFAFFEEMWGYHEYFGEKIPEECVVIKSVMPLAHIMSPLEHWGGGVPPVVRTVSEGFVNADGSLYEPNAGPMGQQQPNRWAIHCVKDDGVCVTASAFGSPLLLGAYTDRIVEWTDTVVRTLTRYDCYAVEWVVNLKAGTVVQKTHPRNEGTVNCDAPHVIPVRPKTLHLGRVKWEYEEPRLSETPK